MQGHHFYIKLDSLEEEKFFTLVLINTSTDALILVV